MSAWLLVLAGAALRGDDHTDPDNKPDAVSEEGEWVWVPSSTAQQGESATAGESGDTAAADTTDADAAEDQKNKEIWRMKEDVGMLRDAMQTLDEAYTSANQIAAYVGGHAEIMEDLAGNVRRRGMASLLEVSPDGSQDMQELDDSFDGLGALTDRVQSANQLLAQQLQKIPDSIVAPSALKLPQSAADLLAGPSSLLQEDPEDAEDPEDLAYSVAEKKMAAADQAELKQSFRGLDEMKEELSKKAGSLDSALGELTSFAKGALDKGAPASLVEHRAQAHKARAGHWEWRHHPHHVAHNHHHAAHEQTRLAHQRAAAQHPHRPAAGHAHAGHAAGHHAPHHSHHRGLSHQSLVEQRRAPTVAGVTEAEELAELDKALDPLETITSGVKHSEAKMASDLSDIIAQGVEVDSKGNMRAQH